MLAIQEDNCAIYPRVEIREIADLEDYFVVVAALRFGVYEIGSARMSPREAQRLRQALAERRDLMEASIPVLYAALGWRPDMIPPGPEAPSLINRAPHSPALLCGQCGIEAEGLAPPLPPEELEAYRELRRGANRPSARARAAPDTPPAHEASKAVAISVPLVPPPKLADLKPDMPLTLAEACRLVFRDHIKPATLKAEARRGHLVIERIGRRDFVTLAALAEMRERCRLRPTD